MRWDDINFEKSKYGKWVAYPLLLFFFSFSCPILIKFKFCFFFFSFFIDTQRYGQSKTANSLFAMELNRQYRERGITSNAVHPGIVKTNLQRHDILPPSPLILSPCSSLFIIFPSLPSLSLSYIYLTSCSMTITQGCSVSR